MPGAPARPRRLRPERPWREPAPLYRDLFADPAVAAALWPGAGRGPRSIRQALSILAEDIAHWQRESFGPWVFFEAASGLFVGRGGLRRATVAGIGCVEVLYAVRSDAWGEGDASEMAAGAGAYAPRLRIGGGGGVAPAT